MGVGIIVQWRAVVRAGVRVVCAAPTVGPVGWFVLAILHAGWRFELVLEWLGLFEMLLFERFC